MLLPAYYIIFYGLHRKKHHFLYFTPWKSPFLVFQGVEISIICVSSREKHHKLASNAIHPHLSSIFLAYFMPWGFEVM